MSVPSDDRGLLLGDGLFETLLARAGALVALEAHLDRMAAGCQVMGLPPLDRGEAQQLMTQALDVAGLTGSRAAVRLTLTAGPGGRGLERPVSLTPRMFATATPAPAPMGPARLMISGVTRNAGSPASRLKTLSYLDNVLARREALAQGADEAVMCNGQGHLAGAAAANLFWILDGKVQTPALSCGVLAGTVRTRVMDHVAVAEVTVGAEVLTAAEAVFITNSLIGVRAVARLGHRTFAPSARVTEIAALIG